MKRIILIALVSAKSFAGPLSLESWPAKNESCIYQGSISGMTGQVQINTDFSKAGSVLVARAMVIVNASKFGIKKTFVLEEQAVFSAVSGNMLELRRQQRDYGCIGGGKGCVQNIWDVVRFNWKTKSAKSFRIDGTNEAEFAQKYPKFTKYWPLSMAGRPWFNDFFSAAPDARKDMDVIGFNQSLSSPTIFALFLSRYIPYDPNKINNYQIISHVPKGDKRVSLTSSSVSYVPAQPTSQAKVALALGNFMSPKGRPSVVYVDNATRLVRGMDVFLQNPYLGLVSIKLTPKGCR
jgi:hypothetical protein